MTFQNFLTLKNLDLTIKQGEFVCIIGDVGSGKSSLLNSIIGDLQFANNQFFNNHVNDNVDDHLIEAIKFHAKQEVQR